MNAEQKKAARESMMEWLSHPQELGREPAKIQCTGTFELYDMTYYIFKYKKNLGGKWLLGVCGGYEGDELEHCGHVFSEMEEYNEATAVEQATKLVEMMRQYWMEAAEAAEKQKESAGTFVNFVLLEQAEWDKEKLMQDLKDTWQIEDEPEPDTEEDIEEKEEEGEDSFIINYQGAMIAVSLMPGPIPEGEAEYAAGKNFMWKDGAEQVKRHQAHLLVAVIGRDLSPVDSGILLVKTIASCCGQSGVLGVYANEVVYSPEYYSNFAGMLKEDMFPIFNLVWFGLYQGKKGICGYTCGMQQFGYDEMEVIDSKANAQEVHEFLSDIANYVITEDVILRDGETIGFSAEQKLPITKSAGKAVEGESLKIEFHG